MTRRSGTRSRTGCFECRRKKIKCDETQPQCGQCRKKKQVCSIGDSVFKLDARSVQILSMGMGLQAGQQPQPSTVSLQIQPYTSYTPYTPSIQPSSHSQEQTPKQTVPAHIAHTVNLQAKTPGEYPGQILEQGHISQTQLERSLSPVQETVESSPRPISQSPSQSRNQSLTSETLTSKAQSPQPPLSPRIPSSQTPSQHQESPKVHKETPPSDGGTSGLSDGLSQLSTRKPGQRSQSFCAADRPSKSSIVWSKLPKQIVFVDENMASGCVRRSNSASNSDTVSVFLSESGSAVANADTTISTSSYSALSTHSTTTTTTTTNSSIESPGAIIPSENSTTSSVLSSPQRRTGPGAKTQPRRRSHSHFSQSHASLLQALSAHDLLTRMETSSPKASTLLSALSIPSPMIASGAFYSPVSALSSTLALSGFGLRDDSSLNCSSNSGSGGNSKRKSSSAHESKTSSSSTPSKSPIQNQSMKPPTGIDSDGSLCLNLPRPSPTISTSDMATPPSHASNLPMTPTSINMASSATGFVLDELAMSTEAPVSTLPSISSTNSSLATLPTVNVATSGLPAVVDDGLLYADAYKSFLPAQFLPGEAPLSFPDAWSASTDISSAFTTLPSLSSLACTDNRHLLDWTPTNVNTVSNDVSLNASLGINVEATTATNQNKRKMPSDVSILSFDTDQDETAFFLRHYTHYSAPSLNCFHSGGYFANQVVKLARLHSVVRYAACALVARQLSQMSHVSSRLLKTLGGRRLSQGHAYTDIDEEAKVEAIRREFWQYYSKYEKKATSLLSLSSSSSPSPSSSNPCPVEEFVALNLLMQCDHYGFDEEGRRNHLNGMAGRLGISWKLMTPAAPPTVLPSWLTDDRHQAVFWFFCFHDCGESLSQQTRSRLNPEDWDLWRSVGLQLHAQTPTRCAEPVPRPGVDPELAHFRYLLWLMCKVSRILAKDASVLSDIPDPVLSMTSPSPSKIHMTLEERWTNLSQALDRWFSNRPSGFHPDTILLAGGSMDDAMDIDTLPDAKVHKARCEALGTCVIDRSGFFRQEAWFSSSIAVVAMSYYHMARMLLLIHRPMSLMMTTVHTDTTPLFSNPVGSLDIVYSYQAVRRHLRMHAKRIVAIVQGCPDAASSAYLAQPVAVAGRYLTGSEAQRRLEAILEGIQADAGIRTDGLVAELREEWAKRQPRDSVAADVSGHVGAEQAGRYWSGHGHHPYRHSGTSGHSEADSRPITYGHPGLTTSWM